MCGIFCSFVVLVVLAFSARWFFFVEGKRISNIYYFFLFGWVLWEVYKPGSGGVLSVFVYM